MPKTSRRHDLDALRVIAFGLLILYHVGMYYVADWGWHIKSPEPSEGLQNLMYLTNPWRMSLLFFVSGAALYFACRKISRLQLVNLRNKRLLLPLVFSMAVIVPPQLYVELVTGEGAQFSYAEFYRLYLDTDTEMYPEYQHGPAGLWTWNHLWFLAYLWVYTLVFVGVKPLLDRLAARVQSATVSWLTVLLLPVGLLTVIRLALADDYPPNNALFGDWYNHARYLAFLFGGYLLADCGRFWALLGTWRWRWLGGAVVAYAVLLGIAHDQVPVWFPFLGEDAQLVLIRLLVSFDQWLWVAAVLGLGFHYLNRPARWLRYMNEAILPWYILHQTVTVLLAFWLASLALPQPLEAALLLLGTVAGCALGYELVKRFWLGRLCFGLKTASQPGNAASASPTGPGASALPSGSPPAS